MWSSKRSVLLNIHHCNLPSRHEVKKSLRGSTQSGQLPHTPNRSGRDYSEETSNFICFGAHDECFCYHPKTEVYSAVACGMSQTHLLRDGNLATLTCAPAPPFSSAVLATPRPCAELSNTLFGLYAHLLLRVVHHHRAVMVDGTGRVVSCFGGLVFVLPVGFLPALVDS